MLELEMKLYCIGMDINPNSNLQRFHMAAAMAAMYCPRLAN